MGVHNGSVLNITVYSAHAQLISELHELLNRVQDRAPIDEVELRIAGTRQSLKNVEELIGLGSARAFHSFRDHLRWLLYWYQKGEPNRYASDVTDLQTRDLSGVIHTVGEWAISLLDPRLVAAVSASWRAQHYGNAARDAFVCLEGALRMAGNVDEGLPAAKLVARVLGDNSHFLQNLPENFMGDLEPGEKAGLPALNRGAFLLIRNAISHRSISF